MTSFQTHIEKDQVLGCILAGGQSRRMGGGDKPLLDLGGKTMLDLVVGKLKPQVGEIILSANGAPERFERFGLTVVADPIDGFAGPLAGVLAALSYAKHYRPNISHVVSVAADTPFFPADLTQKLSRSVPNDEPVIALASSSNRLHPVFALWPVALCAGLENWLQSGKTGKVIAFAEQYNSVEVTFEMDSASGLDPFFNANRPEDLAIVLNALSNI